MLPERNKENRRVRNPIKVKKAATQEKQQMGFFLSLNIYLEQIENLDTEIVVEITIS